MLNNNNIGIFSGVSAQCLRLDSLPEVPILWWISCSARLSEGSVCFPSLTCITRIFSPFVGRPWWQWELSLYWFCPGLCRWPSRIRKLKPKRNANVLPHHQGSLRRNAIGGRCLRYVPSAKQKSRSLNCMSGIDHLMFIVYAVSRLSGSKIS